MNFSRTSRNALVATLVGICCAGCVFMEVRRRLPDHLSYHLIFGFKRNALLPGESGDKMVTVASQLRLEAQDEADTVFGLNASHTEILHRPETIELLNAILENAADRR